MKLTRPDSLILTIGCICFLSLSFSFALRPETWGDNPDRTTTKIRLITHLEKNKLQYELIKKILAKGMNIDTTRSAPGHLYSTVRQFENYYVEYLIEVKDSVGTVSGDYGNIGLNGIGQAPTHHNIAWTPISKDSKGWLLLSIIANLPDSKLQYNSTLN